ncbi:MAG: sigma-70 family RNA polymerase sigma factor [Burkholderiales bacterium]|nr:sigma-70 family RNA polymerase sigma factor [Burkholderiales bacterium]
MNVSAATTPSDLTNLLKACNAGDVNAHDALFAVVYRELRSLARSKLSRESTLTMLDPTSLVHESWLRLMGNLEFDAANRRVFFSYAGKVMRSVMVDYVRERDADKRGSGERPLTLVTEFADAAVAPDAQTEFVAIHQALQKLKLVNQRCHDVVELRYFGGLSLEECAEQLGVSVITIHRDWEKARLFLSTELGA